MKIAAAVMQAEYFFETINLYPNSTVYPLTLTKSEIEELVDIIAGEEYNDYSSGQQMLKNTMLTAVKMTLL